MFSRLWTNLVLVASLAVLGGVAWFFFAEYRQISRRNDVLAGLKKTAEEEGPCAALESARARELPEDAELGRAIELRRRLWAGAVVGEEDNRGRRALIEADAEGLIDRTLCEQIKLVRELGEVHPVLELLRFTRHGGDACEDPNGLDKALAALSSHRPVMLHSLMEQVGELGCLPPWLATKIAARLFEALEHDPEAVDDVDVLRVAKFLERWSPVRAAQFSCWIQAAGLSSRLGTTLGCTPYQQKHVLPRYRFERPLPALADAPAADAGAEVFLLREEGDRCLVRPVQEPPRSLTVSCSHLTFLSDVQVAVLIESIAYGLARASLIAGVASYDGSSGKLASGAEQPQLRSWYGYNRDGEPLGLAQEVRLTELAAALGEELPDNPLRSYCADTVGARYCYDVDWTQMVNELDGDAVVFLSRPTRIFLDEPTLATELVDELVTEAFGRQATRDATVRLYALDGGGYLIAEIKPGNVELRWRLGTEGPWQAQSFGTSERGSVPPSARLLAAFDLRRDGRPEVLVQRIDRVRRDGDIQDANNAIVLLSLDSSGSRFTSLSTLTIHEF